MKQTKKLLQAQKTITKYGLKAHRIGFNSILSADDHYQLLNENNYFWNSNENEWQKGPTADPPTELIKIRITSSSEWLKNSNLLERLERAFNAIRLSQVNKSKFYSQRPPNHLDCAIYFEFVDELKEVK